MSEISREMGLGEAVMWLGLCRHAGAMWELREDAAGGRVVRADDGREMTPAEAIAVAKGIVRQRAGVAMRGGPSREWLAKAGDAEDATRSVSVGGLASDLGMHKAEPIACGWCNGGDTEVHADSLTTGDGEETPVYQAICLGCGAAGILCESEGAATAAWDAKMRALRAMPAAIEAMDAASRDISEWRQLGRRWQEESPDYGRDWMCPTDAGMERSRDVLKALAVARSGLRGLGDEPDALTLRDVAAAVLAGMDKAAAEMIDQGVLQPWRERLRAALGKGGDA